MLTLSVAGSTPCGYLVKGSSLYQLKSGATSPTLIKSNIYSQSINAIGLNIGDGYLYGTTTTAPYNLVRISVSGTGTGTVVSSVTFTVAYDVGEVDENSYYWASNQGKQWVQVDLISGSSTYGQVVSSGTASPAYAVYDWAYVPGSSAATLYGLGYDGGTNTWLMQFNRTTKAWKTLTNFGDLAGNLVGRNLWASVYAGADGSLYASEYYSGEIWRFPLSGAAASSVVGGTIILTNGYANILDAATC
ncbi:hypothetical protein BJ170DRAFT_691983 [Xylariales sp. AK1849]|nr:hypothetical protein BJ170DRAFT_691983 [Xylariales sp. AK1849]